MQEMQHKLLPAPKPVLLLPGRVESPRLMHMARVLLPRYREWLSA